ncbi:MAG: glycosyltransferase family 4 protein [Pseudomonadota bacterium]
MLKPSDSENVLPTIILIAKHFGIKSGGEAVKAFQFAEYLIASGYRVKVLTHQRAIQYQGGAELDAEFILVSDNNLQRLIWRLKPLREFLDIYYHLQARRLINRDVRNPKNTVLHYIGPVSPVSLRFFPKGWDIVLGPLTGNIYYPPGLRGRASLRIRVAECTHSVIQRFLGTVFPEKRRANVVLVSGYERTRVSLRLAGVPDDKMIDVVDSGVSDRLLSTSRRKQDGINRNFVCMCRLVDDKGVDIAIKAVEKAHPETMLDIYGQGEKRTELEALVANLGLEKRVKFKGWVQIDDPEVLQKLTQYRGFLIPSLAEANGIVMQEAMMIGVPVISTRWGGPEKLADDKSAVYVEPVNEASMIRDFSNAMDRLATSPEAAEEISMRARSRAERDFTWASVAESWISAGYGRCV